MRRILWRVIAATILLCFSASAPAAAQDEPALETDRYIQILRVSQSEDDGTLELLLALPASIGEIDPDQSNFAVIEDGSRRPFSVSPVPEEFDVVIVVDTSGSMQGVPLRSAQDAARSFVEQLPDGVRVAVIGFGATPEVLTTLEQDRSSAVNAITGLRARGETALWDAMDLAVETVASGGKDDSYIVLLSDGGDTASTQTQGGANDRLVASDASLYAITLETPESDHRALRSTSAAVGGTVLSTDDVEGLERLFDEVGDRLSHRYRIVINSDRTDERIIRISVAVDNAVATARTTVGSGVGVVDETPVPPSLAGALVVEEASILRQFTADGPGGLAGPTALLLGGTALFIALLATSFTLIDPLGHRVQSLGSMRAPEASQRMAGATQRLSGAADRAIASHDEEQGLDRALDAAGVNMRPGEFAVLSGVIVLAIGMILSVTSGTIMGLIAAALTALGVYLFVTIKVSRRRKAFDSQLHGTINILVGAMRAGRGLPQALELVSEESASPTAEEFRRVTIETRVGRDPVLSLNAVADRMDSKDLLWISQAIQINRELGGDLTELLENLAAVIRDRGRLKLQVRALSAEGRASGWVIGALPILMYIYMSFVNRDYIALLHQTSGGRMALIVGITAMLAGFYWIRKLVNIKY